jgi:hypothetical protein
MAALVEREILDAVRGIRFGSVEIVIHDSKVVQVIRTEKVRLDTRDGGSGRLQPAPESA